MGLENQSDPFLFLELEKTLDKDKFLPLKKNPVYSSTYPFIMPKVKDSAATNPIKSSNPLQAKEASTTKPSKQANQQPPLPNRSSIQSEYQPSIHHLELYRTANRGKKFKVVADQPLNSVTLRPVLWPLVQFNDDIEMVSVGRRRVIRRKGGKSGTSGMGVDTDPYEGIDIQDIWRLPEKYADLHEIAPIRTTFRSRHLHLLSTNLMELVETEYPFLRAMMELSNLLQGDDVRFPQMALQDSLESSSGVNEKVGLLEEARFVTESMTAVWNEYLEKVQDIRRLLIKAHLQKKELGKRLNLIPY